MADNKRKFDQNKKYQTVQPQNIGGRLQPQARELEEAVLGAL